MTATRLLHIERAVGLSLVALVYLLPMILGGRDGVMLHTQGLVFVMVSVLGCWFFMSLPMCASLAWHRSSGRLSFGYTWVCIGVFAPAVATLPGMALVHDVWGIDLSSRVLVNVALTTVNVLVFANLAIWYHALGSADGERRSRGCLYASLAFASIINMLFPFIPLA